MSIFLMIPNLYIVGNPRLVALRLPQKYARWMGRLIVSLGKNNNPFWHAKDRFTGIQ